MSLRSEFERAMKEGWLVHFAEAARRYEHRPEVLMAIASRESNMGGRPLGAGVYEWLERPGDSGHGFGLMQVDARSFPEWVETGAWRDARSGIHQGAAVLAGKRETIAARAGRVLSLVDSRGQRATFTMPKFAEPVLERVAVAAFNCGLWAAYHAALGHDVDRGTTGQNYSADVVLRATVFQGWLQEMTVH